MLQLSARCGNIILGIRIAPKNKNRKGRTDVRKVETMKKECKELFGNYIVSNARLYDSQEQLIIELDNKTINEIAEEIKTACDLTDTVDYESDNISFTLRNGYDEECVYHHLIMNEVDNLMENSVEYNDEDSRTWLWEEVMKCVEFIRENPYVQEVIITHGESFLFEDSFDIKIFDVDKEEFSIQVWKNIYDFNEGSMVEIWDEVWTEIYKMEGSDW